jgi:DNA-binding protein Fis
LQENKKCLRDFPIDINAPLEDNPALFIRPGGCMTARSSVFSVLLLSVDPDLQAQFEQDLRKATHTLSITAAKDLASVPRAAAKRSFDGVILEMKRGHRNELAEVQRAVDPAHTFILAGSRAVLRNASGIVEAMANGHGRLSHSYRLEDYIESKLGDFVKEMKNGSARNLHPMLIRAVERPLITLALKETNGNQIQAAHLLGMNRNTLRKKITDLRIPIKREKARVV